uniref:cytochrome c oxidase subunit III n=1 Tax=Epipenaeon fissurae TaxID=2995643 RepID=UPI0022FD54F5|nr:cytochrome c oxidase subunit III [Epipenaeon fissurae]WBK03023.1 cytochrome c oxidase subunit 3 [Epipenaeon fissurae]
MTMIYSTVKHPYHIVDASPWPLTSALGGMIFTMGLVVWFKEGSLLLMGLGFISLVLSMIQWWRDVSRESTLQGLHTSKVQVGMKWGMILFITSEVMFFFSFFWAFFHHSLSPDISLGVMWPPVGVLACNPFEKPLLGTLVLLTSGAFCTWAHHSLMEGSFKGATSALLWTSLLGVIFSGIQLSEYMEVSFSISDSVYGSTFFVMTGFHGVHVMIGTSFLVICLFRLVSGHFSASHHVGFEAAAWYWHFVDVVWLFLYIFVYWWGS